MKHKGVRDIVASEGLARLNIRLRDSFSSSSLWGLELGIEIKAEMVYNGARDNCIYGENGRFWEEYVWQSYTFMTLFKSLCV